MRRPLVCSAVALVAALAAAEARAHDMKVMVSRLAAAPGDTDTIYISYGHILPVDSQIDAETLDDYHLHSPTGSVMYLKKEGTSFQSNEVHIEEEGVYQAVAARRPSVWCDVVDKAGNHTHHRGPRSSVTEGTVEAATRSQMFAKALLVSGTKEAKVPEPLGHTIEILPVGAPSQWRSGRDVEFRVLFQGKPLNAADLVASYVGFKPDKAWCYATSTDAKGNAVVRPSQPGTWVLRVKAQRPAPRDKQQDYDYESYTATLVLEIQP